MAEGRTNTDQVLTELLAAAAQRSRPKLALLQRQIAHERSIADQFREELERRTAHAENMAAIRKESIEAWKHVARRHGARLDELEAPGATH